MQNISKAARPILLALFVSMIGGACAARVGPYYPYGYPWYYTPYGTYTVVRRPVVVVDGWTQRTFHRRPYRRYHVRRHNSPVIEYTATNGKAQLQVSLTPLGDSTQIEVRARPTENKYDQDQARTLMGQILNEYQ